MGLGMLAGSAPSARGRPNFIFILTDDQRHDAMGCAGNTRIRTPVTDALASRGVRFASACVTLSICSPSRAACLTGRYGSLNGVPNLNRSLAEGEVTFAHVLSEAGYRTAVVGKWHLGTSPRDAGFGHASTFWANGSFYGREVDVNGTKGRVPEFIDEWVADQAVEFVAGAARARRPFCAWVCTQIPHMDHEFDWKADAGYMDMYRAEDMPLPETWNGDLAGKPPYLRRSRSWLRAQEEYGYADSANIREHFRRYYAATTQMDAALGRIVEEVERHGLADNTYYLLMGDNGWLMGEHGLTSKVLAYEESMRVPMVVAGPGVRPGVSEHLVLNIDLPATILDLAGLDGPPGMQGQSVAPLLRGEDAPWRGDILYEAPEPVLGVKPHYALRADSHKYIRTYDDGLSEVLFEELYDLRQDPNETRNLVGDAGYRSVVRESSRTLDRRRAAVARGDIV